MKKTTSLGANYLIPETAIAVVILFGSQVFAMPFSLNGIIDDPTPSSTDQFAISVDIQGDNVVVSAPGDNTTCGNFGQVYLFDAATRTLVRTLEKPNAVRDDGFGRSVAIDGNLLLLGAPSTDVAFADLGEAHLFDINTGALQRSFSDPTVTVSEPNGIKFGPFI